MERAFEKKGRPDYIFWVNSKDDFEGASVLDVRDVEYINATYSDYADNFVYITNENKRLVGKLTKVKNKWIVVKVNI